MSEKHKRGKPVGELIPVKYYFKAPYTLQFIRDLALEAFFARFQREIIEPYQKAKGDKQ